MTYFLVWVRRTPLSEPACPHIGKDFDKALSEAVAWATQGHSRVWLDRAEVTGSRDVIGLGVYTDAGRVTP